MGKDELALVDSGGERDAELGEPRFSWGVTPLDRWIRGVGIAGGLGCLAGMGLLLGTAHDGLAIGLLVASALAATLAQAYRPNQGDSFQVFEHGLTDGARTLLWSQLAEARFEATDEVTRVGGVETDRVTTYRAELVGRDGTRFALEGAGEDAATRFAWLREAAGHVLPPGEGAPAGLPAGTSED